MTSGLWNKVTALLFYPQNRFGRFPTTAHAHDPPHFHRLAQGLKWIALSIISPTMSAQPPNKRPGTRKKRKYSPTSGLLNGVLETISPPILEGSEGEIVPENLVYIGSYNWVNSPKPAIVVPGQCMLFFACVDPLRFLLVFPTSRYRKPSGMGRQASAHEGSQRQWEEFHRPEWASHEKVYVGSAYQGRAGPNEPGGHATV